MTKEEVEEYAEHVSAGNRDTLAASRDMLDDKDRVLRRRSLQCRVCYYSSRPMRPTYTRVEQTCIACNKTQLKGDLYMCCIECAKDHGYCVKCCSKREI